MDWLVRTLRARRPARRGGGDPSEAVGGQDSETFPGPAKSLLPEALPRTQRPFHLLFLPKCPPLVPALPVSKSVQVSLLGQASSAVSPSEPTAGSLEAGGAADRQGPAGSLVSWI